MLPTVAAELSYADRLRNALDAKKETLSVRAVAKQLAERTGNPVEDERSAIYRYLKTTVPTPERAVMLAEILDEPSLAEVPSQTGRRRARLAELEAEVATFREAQLTFAEEVLARLAALEAALGTAAQRSDRQETVE